MKFRFCLIPLPFILVCSCDHIDAVGDKVNELKDMRKENTEGVEGMNIKTLVNGIQKTGPAVQDIGEVDFQEFISQPGRLNIVDFHADWCGPCKKLGPVISSVVEANAGAVRLGKINVDNAKELSREQGVREIPDVRFYIDGKMVHKFTGAPPREQIEALIAEHSAGIIPLDDLAAKLNGGSIEEVTSADQAIPPTPRPSNAKPLEDAMKPMTKEWLPPGLEKK